MPVYAHNCRPGSGRDPRTNVAGDPGEEKEEGFVWGVGMESVRMNMKFCATDRTCSFRSHETDHRGAWIGKGGL